MYYICSVILDRRRTYSDEVPTVALAAWVRRASSAACVSIIGTLGAAEVARELTIGPVGVSTSSTDTKQIRPSLVQVLI